MCRRKAVARSCCVSKRRRERRFSIGFNRLVPGEPDIEQELVRKEALMLTLPATHPLAARDAIEPACLYHKGDGSPILRAFLAMVRRLGSLEATATANAQGPS